MPICRVKSPTVEEKNLPGGKIIRSQMVGLDLGNGFELPFRVGLGSRPPYQAGEYDIDPNSFGLSTYGDLQLNRFVDLIPLTPVKPTPQARA